MLIASFVKIPGLKSFRGTSSLQHEKIPDNPNYRAQTIDKWHNKAIQLTCMDILNKILGVCVTYFRNLCLASFQQCFVRLEVRFWLRFRSMQWHTGKQRHTDKRHCKATVRNNKQTNILPNNHVMQVTSHFRINSISKGALVRNLSDENLICIKMNLRLKHIFKRMVLYEDRTELGNGLPQK